MAIVYTDLAQPLLDYVSSVEGLTSGNSNSLNINLTLSADYFLSTPQIMTANFGFDGYMGVPGLNGTGSDAQAAANQYNVSWESIDPALNAPVRATYSAVGTAAFLAIYGVPALLADTIPVVFTHPVLGATLTPPIFGWHLIPAKWSHRSRPVSCPTWNSMSVRQQSSQAIGATVSCQESLGRATPSA